MCTVNTAFGRPLVRELSAVSASVFVIVALGSAASHAASLQWKPEKNVEFIVGTSPTGVFDRTARTVQKMLQEKKIVDVPITVVNKPGGGQAISNAYLNSHPGDGHYLEFTSGNLLSNHITGKNPITYTDVTPIALLFSEAAALTVKTDSPIRTGKDLLARLKQDPQSLSFGVGSTLGSVPHVVASLVMKSAGGDVRKLKAVVFKSSGESVTALLGGHIEVVSGAVTLVLPHVKAGKLRMIAVASGQRLKGAVADVPTLKEQGIDAVVTNWRGVIGPRGLTQAQVAYWEDVLAKVVQTEEWKKDVKTNLWEDNYANSQEFRKHLDADYPKLKALLAELGLAK